MKNNTVGLVLQLSSREHEGRRIVDEVCNDLVRFVCSTEDQDGFYLYHPQCLDIAYSRGVKTAALGNYETDGFKFDLGFAMKQTLYVTANSFDPDVHKIVLLVTDSFLSTDLPSVKKVVVLNEKEDLGCKVLVIGVGDKYDKAKLTEFAAKTPSMAYLHITPGKVDEVLNGWIKQLTQED
jgi:hypothetical protein